MIEQKLLQWEDFYFYLPENAEIYVLYEDDILIVADNWFIGSYKDTVQSLSSKNYVSALLIQRWHEEYWVRTSDKKIVKKRAFGLFRHPFKSTSEHKVMMLYSLDKRERDYLEIHDPDSIELLFRIKTTGNGSWLCSGA